MVNEQIESAERNAVNQVMLMLHLFKVLGSYKNRNELQNEDDWLTYAEHYSVGILCGHALKLPVTCSISTFRQLRLLDLTVT